MFKLLFFSVLQGDHEDVLEKFGDNELGEEARRLLKDPLRSRLAASGLLPAVSAPEKGTQGVGGGGKRLPKLPVILCAAQSCATFCMLQLQVARQSSAKARHA